MKYVTWKGVRSSGSFGTLARQLWRSRESGEATVRCEGCTACCRKSNMPVDVGEDEVGRYAEVNWDDANKTWVLNKHADGTCTYLVENRCTIYDDRPRACRKYDCRTHLLGMPLAMNRKVLNEGVMQWQLPATPTVDDENLKIAFRLAYAAGLMSGELDEDTAMHLLLPRQAINELLPVADRMRREIKADPTRAAEIENRYVRELARRSRK